MGGSFFRLFNRQTGASVDNDEIFPVHYLDQRSLLPELILSVTFRCNDVLDPEKLRDSLVELLELDGWRKLGGRLRRNKHGKIEIHVPKSYFAERPAVRFSQTQLDILIEKHPLGQRLPENSDGLPTVYAGSDEFRPFSVPDDFKLDMKEYFTTDQPLTSLHITSFEDATLASLSIPHLATDAMGMAALVRAWSNTLAGHPDRVPTFLGAREDVLETVGTSSDEKAKTPYALEDKQLRGLTLLTSCLRIGWDVFTRKIQSRTIFFPAEYVSLLRQRAQEQLGFASDPENTPFLSDGDLITAWISHMVMSSRSKKRKPVIIFNALDMRSRLDNIVASKGGSYLQNLVMPCFTFFPATEISDPTSFGQTALRFRQSIIEQSTDTQLRSFMRVLKTSYGSTGFPPFFGSSDAALIGFSNWAKAGFLEAMDFGPAVISSRDGAVPATASDVASDDDGSQITVGPGTCVAYWGSALNEHYSKGDSFINYGKDRDGGYRVQAWVREETLDLIQEEFRRYRRELAKEVY